MIDSRRWLSNKILSKFIFALCVIAFVAGIVVFHSRKEWLTVPLSQFRRVFSNSSRAFVSGFHSQEPIKLQCSDVLTNMSQGTWRVKPHTKKDMDKVQDFLHIAREIHFLPYTLQRPDNRCGNVSFEGLAKDHSNSLLWFRALCDPKGDLPCCHGYRCRAIPEEDCQCPGCFDLRQVIHAEVAEWIPSDSRCKITYIKTEDEICRVLRGMTLYFIGDSFVRHVYLALLQMLRQNKFYGPMMEYIPMGMRMACNEHTIYLGMCMNVLDRETSECDNTVKLKFMEYPLIKQTNLTLEAVEELRNQTDAMLVVGIGIHDSFDASNVMSKLLLPLIDHVSKFPNPKPRLLWSSTHAPGLLKTPRVPSQSKNSIQQYNADIRGVLRRHDIPEFNTFQLTENAMSYDGAHYGKGVNFVKAQILINHILELRAADKAGLRGDNYDKLL